MQPKTLIEAVKFFSDLDVCNEYMSSIKWPAGVIDCPKCGGKNCYKLETRKILKCRDCKKQFSYKVGTIFEDSPLGLDKWFVAVWCIVNAKNGISSYELHRALGVTQKSAWFMLHRVRLAMQEGSIVKLKGTVESDETFVGGKAKNMHEDVRARKITGRGAGGKAIVHGVLERGGKIIAGVVGNRKRPAVQKAIRENVESGSTVYTDELYGLTWRDERRSLELLARESAALPLRVVPTFLGAHQMPREFRERRADYVRELATQMLPEVKRLGLARYCDVFCDVGAFTVDEARTVLAAARELGLGLRIHAEELGPSGGARLAAELRADSADHLIHVDDATIDAMGAAGVAPVLLPGTVFALAKSPPPARRMIERGLPVALATDFNPGTSHLQSPLLLIALACGVLRLTVAQALTGATANAAASLRLQDECGALLPGLSADAVLIRGSSHLLLGYRMSEGPIERVLARGQLLDPRDFSPFTSTKRP